MAEDIMFVGMDVHKKSIDITAAEDGHQGRVSHFACIDGNLKSLDKAIDKLAARGKELRVVYEAGPCGFVIHRHLNKRGIACTVVSPAGVPKKPGDRVKTNRRDALKLARSYRSGDLTPVWVPDAEHEALRDLVRAREVAKKDQLRARHRLGKFLLRRGVRAAAGMKSWTAKHLLWVKTLRFEHAAQEATYLDYLHEVEHAAQRVARLDWAIDQAIEALPAGMRAVVAGLQALRGIKKVSAATIVAEVGPLSRFPRPKPLMGYSGMVSREDSTGDTVRRGAITKTGNAHLRRIVGEAAWAYQYRPAMSAEMKKRQEGLSEEVKEIAWKAQSRLCTRYRRLLAKGKVRQKVATVIGRELLGFIWAIGVQVEREQSGAATTHRAA